MKNETRKKYNAYLHRIAEVNGVDEATATFAVDPSVQQKLEDKIQEDNSFLKLVNIVGVDEMKGEKLGLGVSGPIASRTAITGTATRNPRDVGTLDQRGYEVVQTNFDTAITYVKLDQWAKFDDFQPRLANLIVGQQGLDRLMIGWNGVSRAATSDLVANPLLQDINKGWLQIIREQAPERNMKEVIAASGQIRVGPGGDYNNLDALVEDLQQLLEPWYQGNGALRVIVGRKLMHDKYFPLINREQGAQDELAAQVLVSQKAIGGHPGLSVPFFPDNALLLTAPENLSIYFQNGKRRRFLKDEPEKNRIANYESSNEDYVVEDLDFAALAENIVIGDWSAGAGH
jgi:P2 family phage major capsid protein